MRSHLFLALLLPLLIALPAQAQIYKWKDAQGRTVISDTPQPGAGKQVPVVRQAPAAAQDAAEGEPAAAAGPKSWAEKDLEFRQRQQEKRPALKRPPRKRLKRISAGIIATEPGSSSASWNPGSASAA